MNNQTYRITLNAAALLPLAPGETGVCQPHQLVSRPLLGSVLGMPKGNPTKADEKTSDPT